ncbi:MAG: T9SS type A sorting domain-containing protein [Bacteroidota bacterium]
MDALAAVQKALAYTPSSADQPSLAGIRAVVTPNPARAEALMTLDNLSGETIITVHNQAGQQIFRQQLDLSGRVAVRLPVAQQPSGIYYWEVRSGTDSLSGKLIKE